MRTKARTDSNQLEIVTALRKKGASVLLLHQVGKGCPDVLVGWNNSNFLIEIKNNSQPPSKRKLTPDEQDFFDTWQGQAAVVDSVESVIAFLDKTDKTDKTK